MLYKYILTILARTEERDKMWQFTSALIFSKEGLVNVRTFLPKNIGKESCWSWAEYRGVCIETRLFYQREDGEGMERKEGIR